MEEFRKLITRKYRNMAVGDMPAFDRVIIEKMMEGFQLQEDKDRISQILSNKKCKIVIKNYEYYY